MQREPSPAEGTVPDPSRFWGDVRRSLIGGHLDFTTGSIGRAIALLAIPMVLEMSMQSLFGVVDVFFVGKLGAEAVAVVGLTDSLLTLIFAVAIGLSMGTTAMVARRIGEGQPTRAATAAVQAIGLGVVVSLPLGLLGIAFADDLLGLMGAGGSLIRNGSTYTAIILGGNITVMLLFLINSVFRGAGEPAISMRALWIANIINILLDPLLIFGWGPVPALGLPGAAIATTFGRGIGVVYQLARLGGGRGRVSVSRESIRFDASVMLRLLRVSAIGTLQFLISTASFLGLVRITSVFGEAAVAAYTIAVRLIIFVLLPAWGVGNAAATLVGQNLGAGRPDRAERAVWITGMVNMAFLGVITIVFFTLAEPVTALFTDDVAVIELAADCLKIVSLSYVFWAYGMVTVMAFNGAGDTTTPTWINFFVYWALQIPLAYFLAIPLGHGPRGVFVSVAAAQITLAIVGVAVFRRGRWKGRSI